MLLCCYIFYYSSHKASSSWENKIGKVCSTMYRKKTAPFWVKPRIIGKFNWLWPKMATLAAPQWSSGISSICTSQATMCDMYHTGIVAVRWEQLLQQPIHNWFVLNFKLSKISAMTRVIAINSFNVEQNWLDEHATVIHFGKSIYTTNGEWDIPQRMVAY